MTNQSLYEFLCSHSLPRYAMVGIANTFVGLSAIFAIKSFAGVGDGLANLCGYVVGFIFSSVFNSRWTFRYDGSMVAGVAKFAVVTIFAYLCNLVTVLTAVHVFELNSYLAQAMGVLPYAIVAYLGGRLFAFTAVEEG